MLGKEMIHAVVLMQEHPWSVQGAARWSEWLHESEGGGGVIGKVREGFIMTVEGESLQLLSRGAT
jgi:hypothetical protein